MADILLSIKPEFVEKIFLSEKKYEFRKIIPNRKVDKIVIYVTRPICRVVGEVFVSGIISGTPQDVWKKTEKYAGIGREFFYSYFKGCEIAYAYKLGTVHKYYKPQMLSDIGIYMAPQNFLYLKK